MKFATIAVVIGIITLSACGPATGTGSRACERARAENREAADRLEVAMKSNASLGRYVEAAESASAEINRACELGIVEPPEHSPVPPSRVNANAETVEEPRGPDTYFVSVEVTEERTAPGGGAVENRIYRGQRVEVTDRQGDWVRVTGLQYTPRWVRVSHLSRERPALIHQPDLAPNLAVEKIQGKGGD